MQIVGDRLAEWARNEKQPAMADLFGRSAFNRYYYAAFLVTRSMLMELDPKWARTPHKRLPELLKVTLAKRIRNTIKNAQSAALLSASSASQCRSALNRNISELADLLAKAYEVRVLADYEPESTITINGKMFTLGSESADTASNWHRRANMHSKEIMRLWRDLGL